MSKIHHECELERHIVEQLDWYPAIPLLLILFDNCVFNLLHLPFIIGKVWELNRLGDILYFAFFVSTLFPSFYFHYYFFVS